MGTLYIVSTPIGNMEDITIRAIKTLLSANYIACEDTRRAGKLLKQLSQMFTTEKHPKLISFYDEVEGLKAIEIVNLLQNGFSVALISNAGTPLISDPGFKLVSICLDKKINVISVPGSSALLAALTTSGLPANSFWFLGFAPPKTHKRVIFFNSLKKILSSLPGSFSSPTIILYEAPHRIIEVLTNFKEVFEELEIVLAREMTKVYESVEKKNVSEWLQYFKKTPPRGEYVLLFNLRS